MACGVSEHDCDCGGERTVVQRDYLTVMARGRKTKTEKVSVTIPKAEWDKKRFGFYCVNIDSLGLRPFESFEFRCKVDAENSTEDVWELFFTDTLKDPLAVFRVNMGTGIISLDRVRSDVPLASCTSVFDDAYQVPEHTAHVFIGVPSGSGQYYPTTTSFRFIVGRVTNGTVRITDASWREIEHIEVNDYADTVRAATLVQRLTLPPRICRTLTYSSRTARIWVESFKSSDDPFLTHIYEAKTIGLNPGDIIDLSSPGCNIRQNKFDSESFYAFLVIFTSVETPLTDDYLRNGTPWFMFDHRNLFSSVPVRRWILPMWENNDLYKVPDAFDRVYIAAINKKIDADTYNAVDMSTRKTFSIQLPVIARGKVSFSVASRP
jgi:hypothetical protein